jgi:hypothetical protein
MKRLLLIIVVIGFISCNTQKLDTDKIINEHTFLIGIWTGEGNFLDVDLQNEIKSVPIRLQINPDHSIQASISKSKLSNISIQKAKYGFEIKGMLSNDITNGKASKKNHFVLLFIVPDHVDSTIRGVDANFHLKSNFAFDATMKVGGVTLRKTDSH